MPVKKMSPEQLERILGSGLIFSRPKPKSCVNGLQPAPKSDSAGGSALSEEDQQMMADLFRQDLLARCLQAQDSSD